MGDRGATGGAWGARDDASWWQGGAGELQHQQQQMNEEIARSTASATQPHQLYTYKMTGNFSNNSGDNSGNFDYRIISNPNNREESTQQQWWYASGSVQPQQSASPTQTQSSPDPEGSEQGNNIQQNHQNLQQQQDQAIQQQNQLQQQLQQQNLQQVIQQQTQSLQQTLQQQNQQQSLQQTIQQQNQQQTQQQTLQQHQGQQQTQTLQQMLQQGQLQQSLQQTLQVSQAQAQAIVAQAALQQQVAQSLQQHSLHDHLQAVQQQQIQAALQRQTVKFQELQQQAQQQALIAQANNKVRMPRARAYNKPRGRMTAYAFFVQTCREEHKKKHPDENVVFAAFSKKCAERWNTMLEKEKQRFHEMAEQDKKRYDLEMQNYVPPKDIKIGRSRKKHQAKDPNAPKRSLSAFFWFCNDERSKVKANNPEYTMGDIAKELGRRWASAAIETKSKYEALSEQDKARYDREMTAYKKGPLALVQQAIPHPEVEDVHDYDVEDC